MFRPCGFFTTSPLSLLRQRCVVDDLEGCHNLTEVPSQRLSKQTEENQEYPQEIRCHGRNSNQAPSEYNTNSLTASLIHSVPCTTTRK
jgi:hypothetical protein